MKNALATITALVSLTSIAHAKGTPDPKLPKEVQLLHCMVGAWQAKNVQVTMAGKKTKGDISLSCSAVSGGYGVACTTKINIEGLGTIEESDLFGYDPQAKLYHWFAVTNMGETHDHVAMPLTGTTMMFAHSGFQEGKPMQEILSMTMNEQGTKIDFKSNGVIAGQSAWTIVATLIKK
jgi:hypothetical protein